MTRVAVAVVKSSRKKQKDWQRSTSKGGHIKLGGRQEAPRANKNAAAAAAALH